MIDQDEFVTIVPRGRIHAAMRKGGLRVRKTRTSGGSPRWLAPRWIATLTSGLPLRRANSLRVGRVLQRCDRDRTFLDAALASTQAGLLLDFLQQQGYL